MGLNFGRITMKVENNEVNRNLQAIENKIRAKIARREQDLKDLDQHYDLRTEGIKTEGDIQAVKARDNNQKHLIQIADEYQQRIGEYSANVKETNNRLEQEQLMLKANQQDRLQAVENEFSLSLEEEHARNQNYLQDLDFETQMGMGNITNKANSQIQAHTRDTRGLMNKRISENKNKLNDAERAFSDKLEQANSDYQMRSSNASIEHKMNINKLIGEQNKQFQALEANHNFHMNTSKQYFQNLMQQSAEAHNKKYKDLITNQQAVIARLQKQFKGEIDNLVEKNSAYKANLVDKMENDFYQMTKLDPHIQEHAKSYIISLEIPEYEKESVSLNANEKNITLTIARRYNEKLEEPDGVTNESKRSELITKRFSVDNLVNNKKIDQKYEDGILYFKVMKA